MVVCVGGGGGGGWAEHPPETWVPQTQGPRGGGGEEGRGGEGPANHIEPGQVQRKTKDKLLAREALESSTQKTAVAHESRKLARVAITMADFAFASPREPPDKISPELDTLENAKESPSDLDTRVLEREATQWSCL